LEQIRDLNHYGKRKYRKIQMHGVQKNHLLVQAKQEKSERKTGTEEILQILPEAYGA
jgi:hypothetical protein